MKIPDGWIFIPKITNKITVEVEQKELITCMNCKYAQLTYDGECKYCDVWFPNEALYMDGDYFCASAERRIDDNQQKEMEE